VGVKRLSERIIAIKLALEEDIIHIIGEKNCGGKAIE
jgi:hypothetical protein